MHLEIFQKKQFGFYQFSYKVVQMLTSVGCIGKL